MRDVPADLLANTATGIHTVNLAAAKLVDKQVDVIKLVDKQVDVIKLVDKQVDVIKLK